MESKPKITGLRVNAFKVISFPTCPFVQRAIIVLQEKRCEAEVEYIDLSKPPDWFLNISPRGKVPVLETSAGALFESHAICEYLDETTGGHSLMPAEPFLKARDRAWFMLISEDLFFPMYRLCYAQDMAKALDFFDELQKTLVRLNTELAGREFLSGAGNTYGMADVAAAPFVMRLFDAKERGWFDLFANTRKVQSPEAFRNVAAWANKVNLRPSTRNSVPEHYARVEQEGLYGAGSVWLKESLMS